MPEIPTLLEHLARHYQTTDGCNCGADVHEIEPWAVHVAETYQEARTIQTDEELHQVPAKWIVEARDGTIAAKLPDQTDPLAEIIAAHEKNLLDEYGGQYAGCFCGWDGSGAAENEWPGHVTEASRAAGLVTVQVPEVAYKGPHDTEAAIFRRVASNLDNDYPAGGSNVRAAVSQLLQAVAKELDHA